jgi:7,8-dihydroneopterin aldolase/epimerase/oxygenase
MDKIIMRNMRFYGYHGVLQEETNLGQKFIVNATLFVDTHKAGKSDDICDSVSYADVFEDIRSIMEGKPFKLIEAAAEAISSRVLDKYELVRGMRISVEKPEAPVRGIFDFFGVEIERMK